MSKDEGKGRGKDEYPTSNTQFPRMKGKSKDEYPMMKEKQFDLQDRFVDFAVRIIKLTESIPENKAGRHICQQILRSGTSPAANYGEAQSAESKADFIHKLKVALKELRETEIWLKIIIQAGLTKHPKQLFEVLKENDELISILFKSIETAGRNKERS